MAPWYYVEPLLLNSVPLSLIAPIAVGAALTAAFQGQYVAQLTGQTYTITSPIVIYVTGTVTGPVGIDGGGATLISQVTSGAPLIEITSLGWTST